MRRPERAARDRSRSAAAPGSPPAGLRSRCIAAPKRQFRTDTRHCFPPRAGCFPRSMGQGRSQRAGQML